MGKGRIVSGGTDGSYTVELLHNRDRITLELQFLAARLTELQAEMDVLNVERAGLVEERNWIVTDIDTAVANTEEGEIPDVEALLVELAQVSAKIQQLDVRIAMIQGRQLEATKRQQMLEAVPADPQQQAWCADFTEDLTGEVATVEVPAEGVVGQFATWRRVQIRPGFDGAAGYLPSRDGQMFHREGQFGYQAYLNAAILPGVQRWRPQYRIGTISSLDEGANTCTVDLQSEDSSAQDLLIDPPIINTLTLADVPIVYMDCDALAFAVGDRVLIEFQSRDWAQPRVIGFESSPQECLLNGIVCTYQDALYLLRYDGGWIAREAPALVGRVGMEGYWRGADDEVVSWGDNVYWRDRTLPTPGTILSPGSCRGVCYVGGMLRAIQMGGLSGRQLRVEQHNLGEFSSWVLLHAVELNADQAEALPPIIAFNADGTIAQDVFSDVAVYAINYTGSALTIDAIPSPQSSSSTEWSITTFFEYPCPLGSNGELTDGFIRTTGTGSTTRNINGLSFTHAVSSFAEEVYPATKTESYVETLTCAGLGLASVTVASLQLRREIDVYMQPRVLEAAILEVRSFVANDPGTEDALAITRSSDHISGDVPYWRVTSRYHVLDGIVSAPLSTTKASLGTTSIPPLSTGLGAASCESAPCEPSCSNTETGTSSATIFHVWPVFLTVSAIVVPTDASGRYLLTSDLTPNESRLKDGNLLDLLGAQSDYLPASVTDRRRA